MEAVGSPVDRAVTSRWWAEWAWLGGARPVAGVVLEVVDGCFARVESGLAEAPPGATVLAGLTLPGAVNAHSHVFHRALRSRTEAGSADPEAADSGAADSGAADSGATGSFWSWRDQMYDLANRLDPDRLYALARATFAEMALSGITTVGEFHYLHHQPSGRPYSDPNAMGAAMVAAATAAGVRLTLIDTCYLAGGIGRPLSDAQVRFGDGSGHGWSERVSELESSLAGSARVRIGAAVHSVRAVPVPDMEVVGAWAASRGAPLHVHLSEQPQENEACQAAYGVTPTGLLDGLGLLGANTVAVHATHLSGHDINVLGGHRVGICMCPTTERELADGVGPAWALSRAGCTLSLGSDSNAVIDLWEEARAVELDERLVTGRRGHHDPVALLRAATAGGATAVGWPTAGRIEVGAEADFVVVDLGSVRLAGADPANGLASVVFAAGAADVTTVVVAGITVVKGGAHGSVGDVGGALGVAIAEAWA